MIVTAWTNSGNAYGFKVRREDRDKYFSKEWSVAIIHLPNGTVAKANVAKKSFWNGCRELISATIKNWLAETGDLTWPKGHPPKFVLTHVGGNKFRIDGRV